MNKLALLGAGLVTAIIATVGVVVFLGSEPAEAAQSCGVWTRDAAGSETNAGMQIRLTAEEAIVTDPATSRYGFGETLWRDIAESDTGFTLEVLGSDGRYYPATFTQPNADTIELAIQAGGSGTEQTWLRDSGLGCENQALADVACGIWTREATGNVANADMQIRIAGDQALVTDPAAGRYSSGDVLWRNIVPGDGSASLDVLGSDGFYYAASIVALGSDVIRLKIEISAPGSEQTWNRAGDLGCAGEPLSEIACGVWTRQSSNNTSHDGMQIRLAGDAAIVTEQAGSAYSPGTVLWQDIVETDTGFDLDVQGSDGRYYDAALAVAGDDTLTLTIGVSGAGNEQTWVRTNDLDCGLRAELTCGVWQRSESSNPDFDGMKVRLSGSAARVTDPADSPFGIGEEVWRSITMTETGLELEVLGSDFDYHRAGLSASGVDTLTLTVDAAGSGNSQTWIEIDASGCVFTPGIASVVCGLWVRGESSNPSNDGMSVLVLGKQARVVDPAGSRYPGGEVLWRYIVDGDPATLEVLGSDGNYYAAEITTEAPGELELQVASGGSGAVQAWTQVDDAGCGSGVDVVCGLWTRTASSNLDFDGMQVVGSGDRALLVEPSGSPFVFGEVLWRDIVQTPPTATLEVLGTDLSYYGGELSASGLDTLELEIGVSGAGAAQTWSETDATGCASRAVSDLVCGTWTRLSSDNPILDGTTLRVKNGRGIVTSVPSGSTTFAVGDVLWRNLTPEARGHSLDVMGSDGNYYAAEIVLAGLETAELTIGASGRGNQQVWELTGAADCSDPDLVVCGTWTRASSNNPRLDGATVRVEDGEAVITFVPDPAAGFAVGDLVWRGIEPTDEGFDLEVRGSDGNYFAATILPLGIDLLTLHIGSPGSGNEQSWIETGTEGCDLARPVSPEEPVTTATTPPSPTTPTTPTTTPTTTSTITTTTEPNVSAGDCLPGTWVLDSGPFVAALMAASGGEGLPPGTSFGYGSGVYDMVLHPDGTFESHRVAWELVAETPEGTMYITFDGVQTGVATWDDVTISADEQSNTTSLQMSFDIGTGRLPIPGGNTVNTETFDAAGAPYTCEGDVLRVTAQGLTSVWNRQS